MSTISSVGNAIQWTQGGTRVPTDSFMLYAEADQAVADSTVLSDANTAASMREASATLKAAAAQQLDAAEKAAPPALADQARGVALNVLMCATFAGALDQALFLGLKEMPSPTLATIADDRLRTDMEKGLGMLAPSLEQSSQMAEMAGKGGMNRMVSLMQSRADEFVAQAEACAGKTDAESQQQYQSAMENLFMGGYNIGAGQAAMKLVAQ